MATPFNSFISIFIAVLLTASGANASPIHQLTVVQLNDVYEIFPVPTLDAQGQLRQGGGMAQVATQLQKLREEGPVLLLHGGDIFSPSLLSTRLKHRGAQMIKALNALPVDVATLGNHEFDYGCQTLLDRLRQSRFPWVVANVDLPPAADLPPGTIQPTLVVEKDGLKVGLFGVTLPLDPVQGCGPVPISFRDPITAAQQAVATLKNQGVDLIIGITHLTFAQDRKLAAAVPDIDLIVGGHEHEVLEAMVGETLITKAGANAINLGLIRLKTLAIEPPPPPPAKSLVVEKGWRLLSVDPAIVPANPAMAEILAPYQREIEPYSKIAGTSLVPLDGQEDTLRTAESNLGNYVADAARMTMEADIALINGGGFRDDRVIPPGDITLADVYTMLPFTSQLVLLDITGEQLWAALENGLSQVEHKAGRFPQVSGLVVGYDPDLPPGKRILGVNINGVPLDRAHHYNLATTDFLMEKGQIDGYVGILPNTPLRRGGDLSDAVLAHLARGPITQQLEGRIHHSAPLPISVSHSQPSN